MEITWITGTLVFVIVVAAIYFVDALAHWVVGDDDV
jgi:hypothetical protein